MIVGTIFAIISTIYSVILLAENIPSQIEKTKMFGNFLCLPQLLQQYNIFESINSSVVFYYLYDEKI